MSDASYRLSTPATTPEIVMHRHFAAPPARIWRMYTEPRHLVRFWGSPGCTHPVCEMDVRPGGLWRHVIRVPNGLEFPSLATFLEVDKPRRLVYEWEAVVAPVYGGQLPPKTLNTMEFAADAGGCLMTATVRLASIADRDRMVANGFTASVRASMSRLDGYLMQPAA